MFSDAIQLSVDFFILDSTRYFRRKNIWHKTKYLDKGEWKDCLVIPPPDHIPNEIGVILEEGCSHILDDGTTVRIMAACVDRRGVKVVVDPFKFQYNHKSKIIFPQVAIILQHFTYSFFSLYS